MTETRFEQVKDPAEKINTLLEMLQGAVWRVDGEPQVLAFGCNNCSFLYELKTCPFNFQDEKCRENFSPLFANGEDFHQRGDFFKKVQELVRLA